MFPYIIAAVGGYLIGDSQDDKKFADGGLIERGDAERQTITKTIQSYCSIEGLPEKVYSEPFKGYRTKPLINITFDTIIYFTSEGIDSITIHIQRIFGKVQSDSGDVNIDIKNDGEWEFPEDVKFKSGLDLFLYIDFENKVINIIY